VELLIVGKEDVQKPSTIEDQYDSFNSVIEVQKNITFRLCDFEEAKTVIQSDNFNDWSKTLIK
tara:strand:- start:1317 stop:1505 length:189 start_codon:yes stop_codon:yes gene_type:complete